MCRKKLVTWVRRARALAAWVSLLIALGRLLADALHLI
jgi:hypothetical protein